MESTPTRQFLRQLRVKRKKKKKRKNAGKNKSTSLATMSPTAKPTSAPTMDPTLKKAPPPAVTSQFNITLINMGSNTAYDKEFEAAKNRWQSIIVNDLSDVGKQRSANFDFFQNAFGKSRAYNGPVDDVVIGYEIGYIDGRGGTLGFAGPRYSRRSSKTVISGIMKFEAADFKIYDNNRVALIVMHEMGHVLGLVGTLGDCDSGCFNKAASKKPFRYGETNKDQNKCKKATEAYKDIMGDDSELLLYTKGKNSGSNCGHWDKSFENRFYSELMTPTFNANKKQLITKVTCGALEDISPNGYKVNYAMCDPFPSSGSSFRDGEDTVLIDHSESFLEAISPIESFELEDGQILSPGDVIELDL
eukprot:scaffold479774_cov55-Attheya_sp.AAC.3